MHKSPTRFVIVVWLVFLAFLPRALAGAVLAHGSASTENSSLACDELARKAGFDSMTDYFCPGNDAFLDVRSVAATKSGVWLGPSVTGVMLLTGALLTTDDPELERMTERPINLGVISVFKDDQEAARFLDPSAGMSSASRAKGTLNLRDCACAGCRTPDLNLDRCVPAVCGSWCCVCIVGTEV